MKKEIKYSIIISSFVLIMGVCLIILLNITKKEFETLKIENVSLYQYFGNQRFDYNSKISIKNDNSIVKMQINDEDIELFSDPFYYLNEKKVLFPQKMSVIFPHNEGLQRKIPFFTILDGSNIQTKLVNNNINYVLNDAIIYDGNDLYFLPNGGLIKIGNKEYNLSPFSYVIVNYMGNFMYFDYEKEVAEEFEVVDEEVFLYLNNSKLNLSIDAIDYNGKSRLLLKNIDYLSNLK